MSLFSVFEKRKPSIAFSLDNGSIRWVSVIREKNGIQVRDYGSEILGESIVDAYDAVLDDAAFVQKIRPVLAGVEFGSKVHEINLVIPDHQAVVFHTHVAKEPQREMGDVIIDHIKTYCEAHHLLHFAEYICEYDIILETEAGYDIHVTLVPKQYVAHLSRLFRQAGVLVKHVETAHHAVALSCLNVRSGAGTVLVSFGLRQTSVALLNGDHLVSEEVVPVGAEHLYKTIRRFLNVDDAYAKKIIDRHGILMTHPDNGLLGELHLELAPIYRSIDLQIVVAGQVPYKSYGQRFSTDTLIVYGEGLFVKGLAAFLGNRTNLVVRDLDVWAGHADERAAIMNLPASETLTYAEPLSLALLYLK